MPPPGGALPARLADSVRGGRLHRLGTALDRELMAAFEPPRPQYAPPGEFSHPLAEAVDPITTANFRLIGALYHLLTLSPGTWRVAGG